MAIFILLFSVLPIALLPMWYTLAYPGRATWLSSILDLPHPSYHLQDKRIGLLIAHPDDEAMFFSPTLLSLTDPSLRNSVQILCLSSGVFDIFLFHFLDFVRIESYRLPSSSSSSRF